MFIKADSTPQPKPVAAARSSNPLGVAGLIVSLIGCGLFLFTIVYCLNVAAKKYASNKNASSSVDPSSFDWIGLSSLVEMGIPAGDVLGFLFNVSLVATIGATVSLVGFTLSLVASFRPRRKLAITGMLAAIAGPIAFGLFSIFY